MFRRFLKYVEKYYNFSSITQSMSDTRINPSIPTESIFKVATSIFFLQLGSLNSIDEFRKEEHQKACLEKQLDCPFPSADTMAYSLKQFQLDPLRDAIHRIYTLHQRRHVISKERVGKYLVLGIDGTELFSSKKRCCDKCLQRTVGKGENTSIEYYHRAVFAQLVGKKMCNLLDVELLLPGEDEVGAAKRLFERIVKHYPKAFDVVTVDALYLTAPFIKLVVSHSKDIVCVLKDERRDLMEDSLGIFNSQKPQVIINKSDHYQRWDEENFTSWDSLAMPVRVVRSLEKTCSKGRISTSDWMWVTTLSKEEASTETICLIGHNRWDIENKGFNEAVNFYSIDHCFVHHVNAIEALLLIFIIAYLLHNSFYHLNIKKPLRKRHCFKYFVSLMFVEFFYFTVCPRAP